MKAIANPHSLVRDLPDGPLDIVGDLHGELDALRTLMVLLGYREDGTHPAGRTLVFVGDLVDRGPASLSTVRLVARLVREGRAVAVLGNHDFNLLRGARKGDNGWFFGGPQRVGSALREVQSEIAYGAECEEVLDFFRTLPVAMERPGLRVVHAAWNDAAIAKARRGDSVLALFASESAAVAARHRDVDPVSVARQLAEQNENAVKLLTSGPEAEAEVVTVHGGVPRRTCRLAWWLDYRGPFCVFGHYGRPRQLVYRDIFAGIAPDSPCGPSAMCVDFHVGERAKLRLDGRPIDSVALAALRWPERELVFDTGERGTLRDPSMAVPKLEAVG